MAGEDNFKEMADSITAVNEAIAKLRADKGLSEEAAMLQLIFDGNKDLLKLEQIRAILAAKQLDVAEKMTAEQKKILVGADKVKGSQKAATTFLENSTKKQMGATRKQQNMSKAAMEIVWRNQLKGANAETKRNVMLSKQVFYKSAIEKAEKNAQNYAANALGIARQTAEITEAQAGAGIGGAAVNLASKGAGTISKFVSAGMMAGAGTSFWAAGMAAVGTAGVVIGTAAAALAIPAAIVAAKLYVLPSKLTGFTRSISSMTAGVGTAGKSAGSWMKSLAESDSSNRLMVGASEKLAMSLTKSLRFDPTTMPDTIKKIRDVGIGFGYAPTPDDMASMAKHFETAAKLQGKSGSSADYLDRATKDLIATRVHSTRIAKKMNVSENVVLEAASGLAEGMQMYNTSIQDGSRLIGMFTTGNGAPVKPTVQGAATMAGTMAGSARGLSPAMALLAMGGKGGLGDYYKYQFKSAPEQIGMMQNMMGGLFTGQKGDSASMLGLKTMLGTSTFGLDPYTAAQSLTAKMPGAASKKEMAAATKKVEKEGEALDVVLGSLQKTMTDVAKWGKETAANTAAMNNGLKELRD